MKKLCRALGALVLLWTATPLLAAQMPDDGQTIGQVVFVNPLAGHASAMEEGVQAHMSWALENGDTWTWTGWEIIAGKRTGSYMFASLGHAWSDFDDPPTNPMEAGRSIERNIAPHVEDVHVSMWRVRPALSMMAPDAPLRPLGEMITISVKPGQEEHFEHLIAQFKSALEQTPGVEFIVLQQALGGEGPTYIVGVPHANWASFEGAGRNEGFRALMEAAHGRAGAEAINAAFNDAVAWARSEVIALRPDLSMNQGN